MITQQGDHFSFVSISRGLKAATAASCGGENAAVSAF